MIEEEENTNKPAAFMVPISELIEWNKNPRINEAAVDKVAASIKRFGFGAPIVARKEDSVIIAGHTRLKAAKTIEGMTHVPVRYLDISKKEAEALALADNKLGEIAIWDDNMLASVLNELENINDLGWTEDELKNLLLEKEIGINNAYEEWLGMPEFVQEDKTSFKCLIVHFKDEQDYKSFQELINQSLTEKTKSIWYPKVEDEDMNSKRY